MPDYGLPPSQVNMDKYTVQSLKKVAVRLIALIAGPAAPVALQPGAVEALFLVPFSICIKL